MVVRHVSRLWAYRELLWILAISELKAKHRHTMLGMVWALAQPISMMVVFTLVFSVFVKVPVEGGSYVLFSYLGLVCWLFFTNAVASGTSSLVAYMNLVTKANFPKEVIPLSKLISGGADFLVGWGCLVILVLAYGVPIGLAWLALPVVMTVQLVLTAGMSLWGASLYVVKRDIGSVLPAVLQGWMYMSPVVYPVTVIPEQYRALYMANPMALILEAYRSIVLGGVLPESATVVPAALMAAIVLFSGFAYFKSVELRFADVM